MSTRVYGRDSLSDDLGFKAFLYGAALVLGGQKSGRLSFLQHAAQRWEQTAPVPGQYIPVLLNLAESPILSTDTAFCEYVLNQVRTAYAQRVRTRMPAVLPRVNETACQWLFNNFTALFEQQPNTHFLLLIHRVDNLLKWDVPDQFFNNLNSAVLPTKTRPNAGRVAVVWTGGRDLHRVCRDRTSSLASIAERICLSNLDREAVGAWLLSTFGDSAASHWLPFVYEQAGGQPWLTELFCRHLGRFENLRADVESKGRLLEMVMSEAKTQFSNWQQDMSEEAREIVEMLRARPRLDKNSIAAKLKLHRVKQHRKLDQAIHECVCSGVATPWPAGGPGALQRVAKLLWDGAPQRVRMRRIQPKSRPPQHQFHWADATISIPGKGIEKQLMARFAQIFYFLFDRPDGRTLPRRAKITYEQMCVLWFAGCVLEGRHTLVASASAAFGRLEEKIRNDGGQEQAFKKLARYVRSEFTDRWCRPDFAAEHLIEDDPETKDGYHLTRYWKQQEHREGSFLPLCDYQKLFEDFRNRKPEAFDPLIQSFSVSGSGRKASVPPAAMKSPVVGQTPGSAGIDQIITQHEDDLANYCAELADGDADKADELMDLVWEAAKVRPARGPQRAASLDWLKRLADRHLDEVRDKESGR